MKLPKVLIFTITYEGKEYCFEEFSKQFNNLTYPKDCYRHVWIDNSHGNEYYDLLKSRGLDVIKCERGNNTREALARSQNTARQLVIEGGYDYALSIESDIIGIPPDIIEQLLSTGKEMVGCLYPIGPRDQRIPCITMPKKGANGTNGTRLISPEETRIVVENPGLHAVNSCGLGCTLIRKDILEAISFYYIPYLKPHSDAWFAIDVWKKGFRIFVNSSIVLEHLNVPWSSVDDR